MMKKLLVAVMSFSLVAMAAATASAQATGGDPAASSAPEVSASGAGVLKKAQFRSESAQQNVGTAFTTTIADTVVLTVPGCILAQFHSEVCLFGGTENNQSGQIRTLIGGFLAEGHSGFGAVFISPDQNAQGRFETEGYNAWRCNLNPGTYSVVVQAAAFETGTTMCLRGRTLTTGWKK